jgi:hypothetical protein
MHEDEQKQQYTMAYVRAVAAAAGFSATRPDVDDDSVDLIIGQTGGRGMLRSPQLHVQVKGTSIEQASTIEISQLIKRKNYDDLRAENLVNPKLLISVVVPKDPLDWLQQSEQELILRQCGYWMSLRKREPTENTSGITVKLPRTQIFGVVQLQELMAWIGEGKVP